MGRCLAFPGSSPPRQADRSHWTSMSPSTKTRFDLIHDSWPAPTAGIFQASPRPAKYRRRRCPKSFQFRQRSDFSISICGGSVRRISDHGCAAAAAKPRVSMENAFITTLRASGARRRKNCKRSSRSSIEEARRRLPYTPPTSGALLEVFPGLATAPGDTIVYPREGWRDAVSPDVAANETAARAAAEALVSRFARLFQAMCPRRSTTPRPFRGRSKGEWRTSTRFGGRGQPPLFIAHGEVQPLQVETLRFLQQRADAAYEEAVLLYQTDRLKAPLGREQAIGREVDRALDRELRDFYSNLGVSVDGELVRVHRGELPAEDTGSPTIAWRTCFMIHHSRPSSRTMAKSSITSGATRGPSMW